MSAETHLKGVINPHELYTLDEIKRRLGIRDSTLRAARRSGLRVDYKHGRGYVLGEEWIRYVRSSGVDASADRGTA